MPTNRAAPKVWTLDGEPVDVFDFMEANDLSSTEVRDILTMYRGDRMTFGGGAAERFTLERAE